MKSKPNIDAFLEGGAATDRQPLSPRQLLKRSRPRRRRLHGVSQANGHAVAGGADQ